jgi:catecholate siderophore receptor
MTVSRNILAASALFGVLTPALAKAGTNASGFEPGSEEHGSIIVTGIRSLTSDRIPDGTLNAAQTIDVIPRDIMEQQASSRLQDVLRNVPGITFNAGEGAARGDTVNLRGFSAVNDFFLDGVRDVAVYTRDSFDLEAVEVLKGPSALVFGRGSTGGAINQVSKAPTLAPHWSGTVVGGSNDEIRATADIDQPIGDSTAVRLNAMAEHSKVDERDDVRNRRWGIAPSISLGISGPDTLTASYLHQEENNLQDTGIPFVNGRPADVRRENFYGLTSDRATADVNVGTLRYRHEFSGDIAIANTLRFGSYAFLNRVNSANFGYDGSPGAPEPGEPLDTILTGRDAPSSRGLRTNLTDQTDVTAHFSTGRVSHTLVAGVELGRERDRTTRFVNPFETPGETPPTSLINPDADAFADIQPAETRIVTTAYSAAAYINDTVHIGDFIDVMGGVRYDRFSAHYRPTELIPGDPGDDETSSVPLDRVDHVVSPRAAIIFKPSRNARIYFSYGTSFDPSAEALSLNSASADLGPVKARSFEFGGKLNMLQGRLTATAAVFRTQIDNAQTTDPDHPDRLVLAGDQRVDGVELGLTGRMTEHWEIIAGYTHLNGKTVASNESETVGKYLANVAPDAINLWTEYEITDKFEIGAGGNYLGKRYAGFAEQAILPSYVLVNAMASYSLNNHLNLRVNANNLFNKLAWQGSYYADDEENHVMPAAGRTVLFTAAFRY